MVATAIPSAALARSDALAAGQALLVVADAAHGAPDLAPLLRAQAQVPQEHRDRDEAADDLKKQRQRVGTRGCKYYSRSTEKLRRP